MTALDPLHPRGDVPPMAWTALCAAVDQVRELEPALLGLGWSMADLYGCHPVAPYRHDQVKGLAWTLATGLTIAAMDHIDITLQSPSGAVQRFRRQPPQSPRGPGLIFDLTDTPTREAARA